MMRCSLLLALPTAFAVLAPSYNQSVSMIREGHFDVIVDVRSEQEYENAHITGAVLWQRTNLDQCRNKRVAVYCWTGYDRSTPAAHQLESDGMEEVYDLGGLQFLGPEGVPVSSSPAEDTVACTGSSALGSSSSASSDSNTAKANADDKKSSCASWYIGFAILAAVILIAVLVATFGKKAAPVTSQKAEMAKPVEKPELVEMIPSMSEVIAVAQTTPDEKL